MPLRSRHASRCGEGWFLLALLSAFAVGGCAVSYPEVVIVNRIDERILVRNLSFSGCKWETVLAFGEATPVASCLPGSDRVHFQRFDPMAYAEGGGRDEEDGNVPLWFNYRSISVHRVGSGEFHRFELVADDLEQDFAVPGPHGH